MWLRLKMIGFVILLFYSAWHPVNAQDWSNDYAAIDQRARKSPKKLHEDLPALTAYLCEGATSEIEKIRAIYVWITTHIGYDWQAIERDKRVNHFIRDILDRKVALCFGYAQLFREMCRLAGVRCEIVDGYAKGTATTELPIEEPNHSWNAVQIEGSWYLLDATWGSSTLSDKNEFVLISNDDYFLIRPEQFVRTHLPGNPMWQLLSQPVTAAQFMASDPASIPTPLPDTTFIYADSLSAYLGMPAPRQKLYNQEKTYDFYPTPENGRELGHALIDYAGALSDTLDLLSEATELSEVIELHREIIRHCRRARALVALYPWQEELLVSTMINQAVLLYNHEDELEAPLNVGHKSIIALLEDAQEILDGGADSHFARVARQQCTNYLRTIKGNAP